MLCSQTKVKQINKQKEVLMPNKMLYIALDILK